MHCVTLLQAVSQWQGKIESLSDSIASVMHMERMEKEMRKAEMEANKMQVCEG